MQGSNLYLLCLLYWQVGPLPLASLPKKVKSIRGYTVIYLFLVAVLQASFIYPVVIVISLLQIFPVIICVLYIYRKCGASLVVQLVKKPPAVQKTLV